MRFQYFEIRACVEHKGAIQSFLGEPEHHPHTGTNPRKNTEVA